MRRSALSSGPASAGDAPQPMVPTNRERTLSREITVTQIPSGEKHTLPVGTKIMIHQTLGGSYTVQTDHGLGWIIIFDPTGNVCFSPDGICVTVISRKSVRSRF